MKLSINVIIVIALTLCFKSYSQSELPGFAASPDAVLKKVKLDMPLEGRKYKNGSGYSLNPKLLKEMPKKVALVSFYSFDPGMTKIQQWSTNNGLFKVTTTKITQRNAVGSSGDLALGYYLQSIDELKSKFLEYGMDLLVPDEYLDTDAKKEYYTNYVVERAKFNEWIQNLGEGNHNEIFGTIEGYNVIDIVNEPFANYTKTGGRYITKKGEVADATVWTMDKCGKMVESLGSNLCENLEVDAVIIVYFTIYSPNEKSVVLQNVNMHMFGPNPQGKIDKFNCFAGQFYVGTRVNSEIAIWKPSKKDPTTNDLTFKGFENIMQALTIKMATYLQEGIENGK